MADCAAIEEFLRGRLHEFDLDEVTAVEAARWLDEAGLLKDRHDRPGAPLRELLRAGELDCAVQRPPQPRGNWYIVREGSGADRTAQPAGDAVDLRDVWALTENDVVDSVCRYLEAHRFEIVSRATTNQRGVDVLAQLDSPRGSLALAVEAKGATSSKPGTRRHGKRFSGSQVTVHVARALYTAAATDSATHAAIALPRTEPHEARVDAIRPALDRLDISVLWVTGDRSVETEGPLRRIVGVS